MTPREFLDALRDLIEERFYEDDDALAPTRRRATVCEIAHGVVVRLPDGSAFTLTIVEGS